MLVIGDKVVQCGGGFSAGTCQPRSVGERLPLQSARWPYLLVCWSLRVGCHFAVQLVLFCIAHLRRGRVIAPAALFVSSLYRAS